MSSWHSAYALIVLITGLHFENCPIIKLTFPSSDDIVQATSGNYKTGLDAYNSFMIIIGYFKVMCFALKMFHVFSLHILK